HAGAQVFLDPVDRTWRRGLEKPRPELLTVDAIVDPFAGCGDPLASRDDGGVADHGYRPPGSRPRAAAGAKRLRALAPSCRTGANANGSKGADLSRSPSGRRATA